MPDEQAPNGAAVSDAQQQPAPATQTQQSAAPDAAPETEPTWLKSRLEQAKTAAQKDLLKSLGLEKPDDIKAALAKLKTLEDEKLTEQEKTTRRLAELEPKANRASQLEATVKQYAERELSGLSELQRAAVASLAGDDHARVLSAIETLKPTWASATPAAEPPKPASTTAAAPPPAPAGTTSQVDHKAEYSRLCKSNPFEAARYFNENSRHILQ